MPQILAGSDSSLKTFNPNTRKKRQRVTKPTVREYNMCFQSVAAIEISVTTATLMVEAFDQNKDHDPRE